MDVHPAVCIYQQSIMSQEPLKPSLKKKDQQLLIPGKVRCAVQCLDREHVNNKTMFQFLRCDTNTDKHFHLYCRCLFRLLYFNFQSREKTLFSFCTSGIFGRGFKITWIPHSLSKMSEVPFKVMSDPKIFRVIWQFVNICGAFRQ